MEPEPRSLDNDRPTAVYRLRNTDGDLLYIGMTRNPKQRWKDHRKEMLWWPEVADRHLNWYDTRLEARAAEGVAIREEGPRYNKSTWPDMKPGLPPGVPPQPYGARLAYQYREIRPSYRIVWFLWRLGLQDALETQKEEAVRCPGGSMGA
jgi:hypothetical protein